MYVFYTCFTYNMCVFIIVCSRQGFLYPFCWFSDMFEFFQLQSMFWRAFLYVIVVFWTFWCIIVFVDAKSCFLKQNLYFHGESFFFHAKSCFWCEIVLSDAKSWFFMPNQIFLMQNHVFRGNVGVLAFFGFLGGLHGTCTVLARYLHGTCTVLARYFGCFLYVWVFL